MHLNMLSRWFSTFYLMLKQICNRKLFTDKVEKINAFF